jgi:FixJ family two-component response regulator
MAQTQPVVAIVDDDVFIQRALARLLYAAGWQAVMFTSAEAFLRTEMQASPDCLVLDVWLPGMTGVELLEHLTATGTALPAVIITGRDDLQVRMRAMQAGAVAYLLKPLDGQELLQTLQETLDGREAQGEEKG